MRQNALVCVWGNREDINPKNYELIKELCLKFRGKGAWLHFERYETGYAPKLLAEKEIDLLSEALKNLVMMLRGIYEYGINPDFSNGDAVVRWFETKDNLYYTHPFKLDLGRKVIDYPNLLFEENDHLHSVRAKPNKNYTVEMDWAYLDEICECNGLDIVPLLLIAADKDNGYILDQGMIPPDIKKHAAVINMIDNIIQKYGKPTEIMICDAELKGILADICKKIGVKLSVKKRLPEINRIRKSMLL